MDTRSIGNTGVFLIVFCVCFVSAQRLYAQDTRYIEKRLAALEERVKNLEIQLDRAMNPAQYPAAAQKQPAQKMPVGRLSPVETPVRAKLFNKTLKTAEAGETDDNLAFLVSFENDGNIGIIALKGEIIFRDTYGDSIMSFIADIQKPIPAGKNTTWFGGLVYDGNDRSHRSILNMNIKDIRIDLRLERIAFSDGTIKEAKKKE